MMSSRLWVLLVVITLAPAAWLAAGRANSPIALQGKLLQVPGKGPLLRTPEKDQRLSAITPYLLHTLEDERLANREVRVEGTRKPDGTFEVQWLYTVRSGKLYRVRYFCKLCNIEALEPGNCVCCQQPTELQEIPVDEPRTE
jgi:hypothetical protein